MVNRVSTSYPKCGHSATETELDIICTICTYKRRDVTETDNKLRNQRTTTEVPVSQFFSVVLYPIFVIPVANENIHQSV